MTLSLNRPDKLNAIDNDVAQALLEAIDGAAADTTVRALRVRGNGRAFCAGRDVSAAPTERDLALVQAVATSLVRLDKPVLFAVHGWTIGAGLEWMLNADVVVAATTSRFKLPEASLGVFVTGGLSATLPAYAGLSRAKALTLLGDEFTPEEACAWGLVWRVVVPEDLEAVSVQLAKRLASLQPAVARQFKRVFNQIGLQNFDDAVRLETEAQRLLGPGADATRSGST
ncbi:enoyl-CoA hydratase/isomerase family protein [Variovorax sp. J22R133]|uniref:enoyl-CoA hydratase/isomerase family protein n=1 Tax=Variovorax brevis TaxID=3053503 RepID=UPI0025782DB2|nr:enoyl-CoA hydratase/isomerase family protein [Variovorax sp. J22R133]MDM0116015.1 enoyl-CoA hydratase/isomerase family protein [Variovorax sp. J22R133]